MTAKSLLIVGAMGLASLSIASAKSYDIVISDATMAGTTQLQPGEYKLKVEGSQAVFTDVQTSKSWTAPVKVQNVDRKFGQTVVETTQQGDMAHIDAIDLAGSNTKLAF
jgi:hypothetical protein